MTYRVLLINAKYVCLLNIIWKESADANSTNNIPRENRLSELHDVNTFKGITGALVYLRYLLSNENAQNREFWVAFGNVLSQYHYSTEFTKHILFGLIIYLEKKTSIFDFVFWYLLIFVFNYQNRSVHDVSTIQNIKLTQI